MKTCSFHKMFSKNTYYIMYIDIYTIAVSLITMPGWVLTRIPNEFTVMKLIHLRPALLIINIK